MKKTLLFLKVLVLIVLLSSHGYSETQTGSYQGEIQGIQVGIIKESDLSMDVARVVGMSTYTTFSNVVSAKFQITGDSNTVVNLNYPNQVILTKQSSSETATVQIVCKKSQEGYVNTVDEGEECGSVATLSSQGKVYLTFFPSQVEFSNPNATGTYIGSLTVVVLQQ